MIEFSQVPRSWGFFDVSHKEWLHACASTWGGRIAQLHYQFLTNQGIEIANSKHLGHNYPTDVITFPYAEGQRVVAECLIGYERVEEQARARGLPLEQEAARVMAHGLLHCLGFNDQTAAQKQEMRAAEDYCLVLHAKNL